MKRDAWKSWYAVKEEVIDEDMPLLENEFRKKGVSKILDLGCGTGRRIIYFAERGFNVYGFDFAAGAIRRAKERLRERKVKAHLRIGDARRRFPYPNEFFDAVLGIRVIHHYSLGVIKKIIAEIARVVAKDGCLYLQLPTLQRVEQHARKAAAEGHPHIKLEKGTYIPATGPEKGVPHHGFTKQELHELFREFRMHRFAVWQGHYNLLAIRGRGKIKKCSASVIR